MAAAEEEGGLPPEVDNLRAAVEGEGGFSPDVDNLRARALFRIDTTRFMTRFIALGL